MEEKIKLADGKEYTLSSFNIGDFVEIEEKFGTTELDSTKMSVTVFWLFLAIKKKHKDLKLEQFYELVTAPFMAKGGLIELLSIMSRINEWNNKDKNVKNAPSPKVENQ